MDAHRINVLNAANDYNVINLVPHNLEFVLFPTDD